MKSKKLVLMTVLVIACITSNIYGDPIFFDDDTLIKDGDVYDYVWALYNATIEMRGGGVYQLEMDNTSTLNFLGGNINVIISANSSIVNMWGGEAACLSACEESIVNIYGGTITGTVPSDYWGLGTWGDSHVNIYGGSVPVAKIWDNSLVTIYGTNFNYPAGLYPADSIQNVVGTLASGEPINMAIYGGYDSGIMLVIAPEPATLLLLGLGGLMLRKRKAQDNRE